MLFQGLGPTALLAAALLAPGPAGRAQAQDESPAPSLHELDAAQPLTAQDDDTSKKKKAKKKKKKKSDEEGFGPDDVQAIEHDDDRGIGVHREQLGVDHPYTNELNGSTTLQFLSSQPDGGSATSETLIDVAGEFLFILGHVELGPELDYSSSETTETVTTTDPTTKITSTSPVDTKTQTYAVGPVLKINFGSIDHNTLVPFVYLGAAYRGGSTQQGSAKAVNTTGYHLRLGGGLNMFLSNGVAFQPKLEYRIQNDKPDTDGAVSTTTSGIKIVLGIGTFI